MGQFQCPLMVGSGRSASGVVGARADATWLTCLAESGCSALEKHAGKSRHAAFPGVPAAFDSEQTLHNVYEPPSTGGIVPTFGSNSNSL